MLKVAVGVVRNNAGEVLISRRAKNVHQGSLWEFPGGKVEANEDTFTALKRELLEELGISVLSATPLIKLRHQYTDLSVQLDVLNIDEFEGDARGLEGQPVKWVPTHQLHEYQFPVANKAIITALQLPRFYPIVDSCLGDSDAMLKHLQYLVDAGYRMVQLRAKNLVLNDFINLAKRALSLSKKNAVNLYINTSFEMAAEIGATCIHLESKRFMGRTERFENERFSIAASCHSEEGLYKAKELGAHFAVLSAVKQTKSHIGLQPLGWSNFESVIESSSIPVYALGGLEVSDVKEAVLHGAQGIAGIRGF